MWPYVLRLVVKVIAAYGQVDGLKSSASWLPVHRDQLRAQHSVTSMEKLYLIPFSVQITQWKENFWGARVPACKVQGGSSRYMLCNAQRIPRKGSFIVQQRTDSDAACCQIILTL